MLIQSNTLSLYQYLLDKLSKTTDKLRNTTLLELYRTHKSLTPIQIFREFGYFDAYNIIQSIHHNKSNLRKMYEDMKLIDYNGYMSEFALIMTFEYLLAYGLLEIPNDMNIAFALRYYLSHHSTCQSLPEQLRNHIQKFIPLALIPTPINDKILTNITNSFFVSHLLNTRHSSWGALGKTGTSDLRLLDQLRFWCSVQNLESELVTKLYQKHYIDIREHKNNLYARLNSRGQALLAARYSKQIYQTVHLRQKIVRGTGFVYDLFCNNFEA